jgi:flavodoxin
VQALILFRSHYGNTRKVAEALAAELTALGHGSVVHDLRRKLPDPEGVDLVFIGAPTRMAKVTRRALRVLKRLGKRGFSRKPIAIFDTYGPLPAKPEDLEKGRKWLYPGAAGIMQNAARTIGLNVYPDTLRSEVKGMKGPLAEDALDRARAFVKEFISAVAQKRAD